MSDHDKPEPEASAAGNAPRASATTRPETDTAEGFPLAIHVCGRTDVGQIREHNEDNFVIADLSRKLRGLAEEGRQRIGDRGTLLGVCDGMGGAAAGEVASQLAVDIVFENMTDAGQPADRNELAARLVESIEAAGRKIFNEARADRTRRGMGTTATVATLLDNHLFLGQVGDSRGYILRKDRLVQATRDQSLVNQLIEAGQLTEEEAETFEHNNIILQALGTAETVQVDLTYVELRRGDTLMLCSDGLSGMVRNDEIREVLLSLSDPEEACAELIERANRAGGHDNITVVVAKFDGESLPEPTDEDVAELKYRKYELPEAAVESLAPSRAGSEPRSSIRPKGYVASESGSDDVDDLTPHLGTERETLTDATPAKAPAWLLASMFMTSAGIILAAGYYILTG